MVKEYLFENYKCFQKAASFENPSLVNLIIGRNNSGKSSFLDVIECIFDRNKSSDTTINTVSFTYVISQEDVDHIASNLPQYYINGSSVYTELRELLKGREYSLYLNKNDKSVKSALNQDLGSEIRKIQEKFHYIFSLNWNYVIDKYKKESNCFSYDIVKVAAERDVRPEPEDSFIMVDRNGTHLTNAITYNFLQKKGDKELIKLIKEGINDILIGEDEFSELKVLKEGKDYAIHLTNRFGDIALNDMGSGLKTIIQVLYSLYSSLKNNNKVLFMFEELENNLHPQIQRRLFNKIYEFAVEHQTPVYITSHSHVAINCFYGKEQSTVYRIHQKDGLSTIEKVDNYIAKSGLLDDLGVKASDLFQTNGIIWVEGPSDRIYIKKWISLIEPSIKENEDYCFMYYGGKNLAHFTAEEVDELIRVLLINRNGIMVMDSDLLSDDETINETKTRIKNEFERNSMPVWVTKGKEIENYISCDDLKKIYQDNNLAQIKQYEKFPEYIKDAEPNFSLKKVEFAKTITPLIEKTNVLDLEEKIKEVVNEIKKWNKKA